MQTQPQAQSEITGKAPESVALQALADLVEAIDSMHTESTTSILHVLLYGNDHAPECKAVQAARKVLGNAFKKCEVPECATMVSPRRRYCLSHQSVEVRNRLCHLRSSKASYRAASTHRERLEAAFEYALGRGWIRGLDCYDSWRSMIYRHMDRQLVAAGGA